jgi:hypothetical protein
VPAVVAAGAAGGIVVTAGIATGAAGWPYLVDLAAFGIPVALLLNAGAVAAGATSAGRWIVLLVWGVVVLPAAALGPLLATAGCAGTECELQDFGGALPLAVAPAAFALLAALPAARAVAVRAEHPSARDVVLGLLALFVSYVLWLAAMEGDIDVYTPRLLLAAVVGPLCSAVAWLLVDRLRGTPRSVARSVVLGLLAGMVATLAGSATVVPPWSIAVALLAGAIGAGVETARHLRRLPLATRWGIVVLVAALLGLVAPVIIGDAVGVLLTAQAGALPVPFEAFGAVAGSALVVSVPAWIVARALVVRRSR